MAFVTALSRRILTNGGFRAYPELMAMAHEFGPQVLGTCAMLSWILRIQRVSSCAGQLSFTLRLPMWIPYSSTRG